jgi:hypothetical protein
MGDDVGRHNEDAGQSNRDAKENQDGQVFAQKLGHKPRPKYCHLTRAT